MGAAFNPMMGLGQLLQMQGNQNVVFPGSQGTMPAMPIPQRQQDQNQNKAFLSLLQQSAAKTGTALNGWQGLLGRQRPRSGNSLSMAIPGLPQLDNSINPNDVAPAPMPAAGGGPMQALGNLLSPAKVNQFQERNRASQGYQNFMPPAYGGGIARMSPTSWAPQGQKGPRTFALTAS